jgi:Cu-processing system ATP-binding protein
LSELDDLVTEVFYMQEGKLLFHKKLSILKEETGEIKLAKAIGKIMNEQEAVRY